MDAMSLPRTAQPRVTIAPTRGLPTVGVQELYAHRELIFFFVWRDIKVRYRQTVLGIVWVVIQPILTMLIMAVVFGFLTRVPSDGTSYPVFSFAGLLLWSYFSQAVTNASTSVLSNAQLVEKIYFPRLAIPIAAALSLVPDLCIRFFILLGIMAIYGYYPQPTALLSLPLFFTTIIIAVGIGAGFAALSVRFRDVTHLMPLLVQLWLFATPVIYPVSLLPARWQLIAAINPLVGVIETFRWCLLGTNTHPWPLLAVSLVSASVLVTIGTFLFRTLERSFADEI
jgi:lipopolysaccharide transport system permease protein